MAAKHTCWGMFLGVNFKNSLWKKESAHS